jgi:hypothetical protein
MAFGVADTSAFFRNQKQINVWGAPAVQETRNRSIAHHGNDGTIIASHQPIGRMGIAWDREVFECLVLGKQSLGVDHIASRVSTTNMGMQGTTSFCKA